MHQNDNIDCGYRNFVISVVRAVQRKVIISIYETNIENVSDSAAH